MALAPMIIAGVSAVAGIASGVVSYTQQKNQADAQYQQQMELAQQRDAEQKAYNERLLNETIYGYQQLDKEENKLIFDTHTKSMRAQMDALQTQEKSMAVAGASGMAGRSVETSMQKTRQGLGQTLADITYQQEAELRRIDDNAINLRKAHDANYDNQVINKPTYSGPSIASAGLGALNTGLSAYQGISGTYNSYKSMSTPKTVRSDPYYGFRDPNM